MKSSGPDAMNEPQAAGPLALAAIRRSIERCDIRLLACLLHVPAPDAQPAADRIAASGAAVRRHADIHRQAIDRLRNDVAHRWHPRCDRHLAGELLWSRIALGEAVAMAKLAAQPGRFAEAIRRGDAAALRAAVTFPDVEEQVYARAARQVAALGSPGRAEDAAALFREVVVPLTKELQVAALLARGDGT